MLPGAVAPFLRLEVNTPDKNLPKAAGCQTRQGGQASGSVLPGGGEALGDGSHTGFWIQCCQK